MNVISLPESTVKNMKDELDIFLLNLLADNRSGRNEEHLRLSFLVLKKQLLELDVGCSVYYNVEL